jgi:hypothetical protein
MDHEIKITAKELNENNYEDLFLIVLMRKVEIKKEQNQFRSTCKTCYLYYEIKIIL